MKVRDLIAGLEALSAPELDVYFLDVEVQLHPVDGGTLDTEEGSGRQAVILAPHSLADEGGF